MVLSFYILMEGLLIEANAIEREERTASFLTASNEL